LAGVLLGAGRTARAADDELAPRHAEVVFVAPSDDVQGLELVLGELLARLEVSVRFMRVPTIDTRQILVEHAGDPPAVARAWIDLRDPSRVTLFLSGAHQDRLLIRQVPLVARVDEVAREEIAHIVEATVDALLIGGRIGVITEEGTSTKVPVTSIPQRARGGPRLDLSVGYEAQGWSADYGPQHGPAIFLGFTMGSGAVRGGFLASAQYRLSSTVTTSLEPTSSGSISTRLDQGSFRGLAVIDAAVAKRWTLRGGLGGGVDLLRFSPTTESPNVALSAASSTTVPMLRALVAMRYSFTRRSDVFFGLGADFDLVDTRYIVQGPGGDEHVVFQPWRLRPMALVGIGSDILAQ
jgi:hypothetical protein